MRVLGLTLMNLVFLFYFIFYLIFCLTGDLALSSLIRHLRFYDSVAALTATYPASRPKLILAIPPSMSHGPSRTLFTQLAENLNALIVLTSRGTPNTLGSELFEMWNGRQERGKKAGEGEVGTPIGSDQKMDIEVGCFSLGFEKRLTLLRVALHLVGSGALTDCVGDFDFPFVLSS